MANVMARDAASDGQWLSLWPWACARLLWVKQAGARNVRQLSLDMLRTVANFQRITRDLDRVANSMLSRPDVKSLSEYYLANIRSVSSVDEFLKNDRIY
jgi:hypothetical protein